MCRVDIKTYIHPDGHREVVETKNRCHNAVGNGLCNYVTTRNVDVRIDERMPSSTSGSQSDDMVIVGKDGKERRYHPLTRTRSHRTSTTKRDSKRPSHSPADSVSTPLSPLPQTYRTTEVMPSALPSARYQGPSGGFSPTTRPADPFMNIRPDGTASYERPSSQQGGSAQSNPFSTRRQSTAAEFGGPLRRPSTRVTRPPVVAFAASGDSSGASSGSSSFSGMRSPPTLGQSRNDSVNDLPSSRLRADSVRDDEELARRLQDEENRQAEIERLRLSSSGRRRKDSFAVAEEDARRERLDEVDRRERNRRSRQAEEAARQRAAENQRSREASRERAERKRREAQDALEGKRRAESREKDLQERADAELDEMKQQREEKAARQRESVERYQQSRSSPTATKITYTYGSGSSPTLSTRSPTGSARPPPAMVHNYPSSRRNSALLERGDAVIERERRRVAGLAGEMNNAMAEMSLDAAYEREAIVDADARYANSERARRERREAERRARQREAERKRLEEGFF